MKCSSRLLFGLLMSCLCFRGSYEEFSVIQSPSTITVNEGESAQISCCWNITTEANNVVKVNWLKNGTRIPEEKRINQTVPIKNCSVLNITSIVKTDTGYYVCKVIKDIPFLIKKEGIKTVLNVSDRVNSTETTTQGIITSTSVKTSPPVSDKTDNRPNSPILHLSLAAAIGLLTLCLAFSVCKMRNSCKKTERMVIHQTPNSEGEEHEHVEEEDGSTGSSRGSLQWYQVPVYWSYFDLRRGEEEQ
ncbi:titin-like [Pseudorasbora parva]|uniref:titin-like n=1 Tax=Pseudorasbora parva TaxID=51549 RepID=UPI00351E2064